MKLTIPSTTVKAHFLRTMAINTIYKDPRNSQLYQIQEKKFGNSYVKSSIPYFGSADVEYLQLEDIPQKCLKQENPVRGNIMTTMKQRISQLELLNGQLFTKDIRVGYDKIKQLLNGDKYFENDTDLFALDSGVIFHLRRKDTADDYGIQDYVKQVWNDSSMLGKVLERQHRFQTKLLNALNNAETTQTVAE